MENKITRLDRIIIRIMIQNEGFKPNILQQRYVQYMEGRKKIYIIIK